MIAKWFTPGIVLLGIALQAAIWLGFHLPILLGGSHRQQNSELYFFFGTSIFAYALAFFINLEIAAEYRDNALMRWSWFFIAANAGISIGRDIINSPILDTIWTGYQNSSLAETHHQIIIFVANSFLVLGLLGIWRSYQKTGLGFAVGRRDYVEISIIIAITLGLIFTVENSPVGLIILSVASVVSVVLYRMATQMNGGKLALALRFLTLYTLLRATLVLLEAIFGLTSPERRDTHDFVMFLDLLCWRTVPWIAVLAAAYRAEMTVQAFKKLRLRREPAGTTVSI